MDCDELLTELIKDWPAVLIAAIESKARGAPPGGVNILTAEIAIQIQYKYKYKYKYGCANCSNRKQGREGSPLHLVV